jgi:hypothetical protein
MHSTIKKSLNCAIKDMVVKERKRKAVKAFGVINREAIVTVRREDKVFVDGVEIWGRGTDE